MPCFISSSLQCKWKESCLFYRVFPSGFPELRSSCPFGFDQQFIIIQGSSPVTIPLCCFYLIQLSEPHSSLVSCGAYAVLIHLIKSKCFAKVFNSSLQFVSIEIGSNCQIIQNEARWIQSDDNSLGYERLLMLHRLFEQKLSYKCLVH